MQVDPFMDPLMNKDGRDRSRRGSSCCMFVGSVAYRCWPARYFNMLWQCSRASRKAPGLSYSRLPAHPKYKYYSKPSISIIRHTLYGLQCGVLTCQVVVCSGWLKQVMPLDSQVFRIANQRTSSLHFLINRREEESKGSLRR